jgi:hypothetical protein
MRLLFGDNLAIEASFLRRSMPLHISQSFATLISDQIMHSVHTHRPAYNIAGFTAFLQAGDRGGLENLSSDLDMIGTDGRYARCRIGRG